VSDALLIERGLWAIGARVERGKDGVFFSIGDASGHFGWPRPDDEERWPLHCRVSLPPRAPVFELDVRPETGRERHRVSRGEAVDVVLQDARFDETFIVEAAPSDLIRSVFDEPVRAALLAIAPCRLRREGDVLHLAAGALGDARVALAAGVCLAVVERLARAPATLAARELAAWHDTHRHGYRDAPRPSRTVDDDLRAQSEIAAVREARRLRRQIAGYPLGVTLIAVLAGGMLLALWTHR
jgi:hypothetical protein